MVLVSLFRGYITFIGLLVEPLAVCILTRRFVMYMFYHFVVTLVGLVELDRTTNDPQIINNNGFVIQGIWNVNSIR